LLKIATTFEAVEEQAKEMGDSNTVGDKHVARVTHGHRPIQRGDSKGECYRCGSTNHYRRDPCCPARGKECRRCGKADHFESMCKPKKKVNENQEAGRKPEGGKQKPHEQRRRLRRVHQIDEDDTDSELECEYVFMNTSSSQERKQNVIPVSIGGVKTDVIIDSGCDTNVLSEKTWRQLMKDGAKTTTKRCTKKLYPYTSDVPLETVTCFTAVTQAGDRQVEAEFVVINL
jgi:hypothetical protein